MTFEIVALVFIGALLLSLVIATVINVLDAAIGHVARFLTGRKEKN